MAQKFVPTSILSTAQFHSYLVQENDFIFSRVSNYVAAVQTITSKSGDYKGFSFLTRKFDLGEVLLATDFLQVHDFDYCHGEWVKVLY